MAGLLAFVIFGMLLGFAGELRPAVVNPVTLRAGCARTPAAALLAARAGAEPGASSGYRVNALRWDPVQQQNWATIQSCDHPERPSLTLLTDMVAPHDPVRFALAVARSGAVLPIVRAGDVVRLWRHDRFAHIEMLGTSEENGEVGSRVRIRLPAPHDPDGQTAAPQYLAGVVRGPANVEMER